MSEPAAMSSEKIKLIEDSFETLSLHSEAFVRMFYQNLFARYPEFRALFTGGVDDQEKKLFKALMLTTQHLRKPNMVKGNFEALGNRHANQHHVMADYYPKFVAVLLETMRAFAGSDWTPEHEAAWSEALDGLVEMMGGSKLAAG